MRVNRQRLHQGQERIIAVQVAPPGLDKGQARVLQVDYRMAHNVWEWATDWYQAYPGNEQSEPFPVKQRRA